MKRSFLVILLGLAAGALAHVGWFMSRQPGRSDDLDSQLRWMKTELKLSNEQFASIKAIHKESSPRLMALAAQVARMREEYDAFERERTASGQVDFIEFAHFVEQRRAINRECITSTQRLVADTSGVMTEQQREHYVEWLLSPVLLASSHLTIN